ncbi:MAG: hypothetical protein R3F17_00735 [Planctomycetota bacterium]
MTGMPDDVDKSMTGELVIKTGYEGESDKIVTFSGVCRSGVAPR